MFAWSKRIRDLHERVTSGRWGSRYANFPVELATKTVLIVGFGRIGMRMARRCVALEMRTLVYDPYVRGDLIRAVDAEPVGDLDIALAQADFVSLHCPKTPETLGLFNAARIARMKKGAVLINTARGGIVDEVALADAIESGHLAGAGLDVFASEPPHPANRLLGLPQVITAPHMAGVTWEAWNRMATTAIRNVFDVFDGRPCLEHAVNPEVFEGLNEGPIRFADRRSADAGD
jgi:D-3-phosphoglycerate dehydrogenase